MPSRWLLGYFIIVSYIYGHVKADSGVNGYAPGRVLVRFKANKNGTTSIQNIASPLQGLVSQRSVTGYKESIAPSVPHTAATSTIHVFKIVDGSSVATKVDQLNSLPEVDQAEPDYQVRVNYLPNDPQFQNQWHHPKVSNPTAWNTATGSSLVKVCVVDSGARIDHPDLAANIIKGWNLVPDDPNGPTPTSSDPSWRNYNDTLGHGTHVSGLIAALGNNARGTSGVSWRASLLVCKFISDSGAGYVSDAITCIDLCRGEGAHVYSNSWGGMQSPSSILLGEIQAVGAAGGLFVVAAGNNGQDVDVNPIYPAAYTADNLLAVAATTQSDTLASFSNYGMQTVHVASPGVDILSTTHDLLYGYMSGTSMATPIVSGAAALLQSMALQLNSSMPLSPTALRSLLMNTVDSIPGGTNLFISGGRINVASAVAALMSQLGGSFTQAPIALVPPPTAPPFPQVSPSSPSPSAPPPPASTNNGTLYAPECGTSALRGASAQQSSTQLGRVAANAVNGDCRNDVSAYPSACSSTDPSQSFPWWEGTMTSPAHITAVSITTRADCCWNAVGGAQLFLGNGTWNGTGVPTDDGFIQCGEIPASGIPWGQRMTVACAESLEVATVLVYLPKLKTSLTLCEVDVTTDDASVTSIEPVHGRRLLKG